MPPSTQNLTPSAVALPEISGQSNGAQPETHDGHDWLDQLLQLPAASEGVSHADLAGLTTTDGLIVLVGAVTGGEHGIPLWQSMSGDPWILA